MAGPDGALAEALFNVWTYAVAVLAFTTYWIGACVCVVLACVRAYV